MKANPTVILLFLTLFSGVVAVWGWLENRSVKSELSQARKDIDSAAAVIGNAQRAMTIFNHISAERAREKEIDRQKGEADRAQLRTLLEGERCAAEPVPVDVERRLREKTNRIRSRSVSTSAGGTLSGNVGA